MYRTLCGASAAMTAFVAQIAAAAAPAESTAAKFGAPDGWKVHLVHQFKELTVCMASRTEGGDLSVTVLGRFATLSTASPSWPQVPTGSAVQIDFEDGESIALRGGAQHGVMEVELAGPLLRKLADAKRISIQFVGHTAVFSTVNFGSAFDSAARCASAPTLAQRVAAYSAPSM